MNTTIIDKQRKRKKQRTKNTITHHQTLIPPISNQTLIRLIPRIELPEEIIFSEILTRLPINSLIRFKLVSKPWNLLISTPEFIQSHLKQTISNRFVPSSCVFIKSDYYFYILHFGAYNTDPDDFFGNNRLISGQNVSFDDNYCCPDGHFGESSLISDENGGFDCNNSFPDGNFGENGLISGKNVIVESYDSCPDGKFGENDLISGRSLYFDDNLGKKSIYSGKNVIFNDVSSSSGGNLGENSLISGKNVIVDVNDSCPDGNLGKKSTDSGENVVFNDKGVDFGVFDGIFGKNGSNSSKNVIFDGNVVNNGSNGWGINGNFGKNGSVSGKKVIYDGNDVNSGSNVWGLNGNFGERGLISGKNAIFDDNCVSYGSNGWGPNGNFSEKGLISVKNLSFYDNGINTFLIGSYNGLVCFGRGSPSNGYDYSFYICNPVMGKSCDILDPLGNFQWMLMYGFGYVGCRDEYLLFVGGIQKRSSNVFVYVYSSKAKVWRKVGVFSEGELSIFGGGRGVLVNETLHWDMNQVWTPNVKCVCGFDLVEETFKEVRMPDVLLGNVGHSGFKLCEINGCLGAWIEDVNGAVEMWVLKEYGVFGSWMMMCKFDMVPGLRGFCGWTENGKALLQTDDGSLLLADTNQSPMKYKTLVSELGDIEVVSLVRSGISPVF